MRFGGASVGYKGAVKELCDAELITKACRYAIFSFVTLHLCMASHIIDLSISLFDMSCSHYSFNTTVHR